VPVVILHALDDGIVPYELGHKVRIRSHDIVCLLLTVKCVLGLTMLLIFVIAVMEQHFMRHLNIIQCAP